MVRGPLLELAGVVGGALTVAVMAPLEAESASRATETCAGPSSRVASRPIGSSAAAWLGVCVHACTPPSGLTPPDPTDAVGGALTVAVMAPLETESASRATETCAEPSSRVASRPVGPSAAVRAGMVAKTCALPWPKCTLSKDGMAVLPNMWRPDEYCAAGHIV
jgi:hypothetical protein